MKTAAYVCAVALALWLPPTTAQEPQKSSTDAEKQQRQEMRKEVDEAVDAINRYSIERRKEAVARARQALEAADRRADRLQENIDERWNRMDAAARQRSQDAMADLRRRRVELGEWTGGLKHGSRDVWDDVKAGFVRSYRDFIEALDRIRAQDKENAEQDRSSGEKTSSQKQQEKER